MDQGGANDGKQMTDTAAIGGGGFDLTSLLFRQAGGHLLHQAAREEVGIDGVLELRNEDKRAYGALLVVQIKALDDVEQAGDELSYTPTPSDAAYAEYQPLPFLLVGAHPSRFEAWWKCLQDAWADPRQRASRTVTFDRKHDRLNVGSGEALRDVFERHRPGTTEPPARYSTTRSTPTGRATSTTSPAHCRLPGTRSVPPRRGNRSTSPSGAAAMCLPRCGSRCSNDGSASSSGRGGPAPQPSCA